LKDKQTLLRSSLYNLISKIHFLEEINFTRCINVSNPSLISFIKQVLLDNLRQFHEDKLEIFKTLKLLMTNNQSFITNTFIYNLFDIDEVISPLFFNKNYFIVEFNWNDIIYNSKMIILQEYLNYRAKVMENNNLFTSKQTGENGKETLNLPKFFFKHFNYLSDKYPTIFTKKDISTMKTITSDNLSVNHENYKSTHKINYHNSH